MTRAANLPKGFIAFDAWVATCPGSPLGRETMLAVLFTCRLRDWRMDGIHVRRPFSAAPLLKGRRPRGTRPNPVLSPSSDGGGDYDIL